MGTYAYGQVLGARSKPYSTSMRRNPYTLASTKYFNQEHRLGVYWAEVLFEMYWNLVSEKGFSSNLYDSKQIKGNVIALQLVIGGMKLQPCNPTFTTARDAILAADEAYCGGAYKCLLWRAFAKRGLGIDSDEYVFKDGYALPSSCPAEVNDYCSWNVFSSRKWCGLPW